MPGHRNFDEEPDLEPAGPFTFQLKGETFTTIEMAPAGVLNDLQGGVQFTPSGQRVYQAPNLISFMVSVLRDVERVAPEVAESRGLDLEGLEVGDDGLVQVPADDVQRFVALMNDKTRVVDVAKLGSLVIWLSQEFSGGRPTVPSTR